MIKLKLLFGTLLVVLIAQNTVAQVSASAHLGGGLASIKETPYDGTYAKDQTRLNTVVGVILHSPIYSRGNLQITTNFEINYELKGISNEISSRNDDVSGQKLQTLHYLTLPAYFRNSIDMGDIELFIDAGVYIASLLGANEKLTGEITEEMGSNQSKLDLGNSITDDLKHFDAGIVTAAGINYHDFNLSLRYVIGLFNINPVEDESRLHNRSLQILLAYDF